MCVSGLHLLAQGLLSPESIVRGTETTCHSTFGEGASGSVKTGIRHTPSPLSNMYLMFGPYFFGTQSN